MSTGEPQNIQGLDAVEDVDLEPSVIEKYGKQIVFGVVALVIVFAVMALVANTGRAGSEESWSKFAAAQSASDFANVASDFPGTEIALWARLTEGEMLLREAVQLQFSDRAAANGQFKKADEALDSVLGNANLPPSAQERALLGKARLLEATSDGNTEAAITAYEKLKGIPNSVYATLVESRVEALKKEETKDFYAWFSKQSPKPEDRAKPQDGLPSGHPELPVTLPPIPEELFPADWTDLTIDDSPPFEIPAESNGNETKEPAGNDSKSDKPANGDAPDSSDDGQKATDGEKPDKDAPASESSTPE